MFYTQGIYEARNTDASLQEKWARTTIHKTVD